MADWIHCNKCFRTPRSNSIQFFLKECGRIECKKCLNPSGEDESKCTVCNKTCKTILLTNNMKPEIQMYFGPFVQSLHSIKKVYEFQKKNYDNLFKHLYQKYNFAKNEMMKCYKLIDSQKKEINELITMLKSGQFHTPSKFSTSTPLESQVSPCFDGSLSTISNWGSASKSHVRPGYPQRINTEESFSTGTSSTHTVPVLKQPLVQTHKNANQLYLSTLMSQMMQHSQSRRRRN